MGIPALSGIVTKISFHFNGKVLGGEIFFKARPGHDDEMAKFKKVGVLFPGIDFQESVQAENKEKIRLQTELSAEVANRLHFVRKHKELSVAKCYLALTIRACLSLVLAVRERDRDYVRRTAGNIVGLVRSLV